MFFKTIFIVIIACSLPYSHGGDKNDKPFFSKPADDTQSIRQKASVRPFAGNVRSYSGLLSVNPEYDAKLFYWFFEHQQNPTQKPLLLWLNGEPGRSSSLSVFEENGPYKLFKDKVVLRDNSWTMDYNMLYIDSSVNTGYSSANSSAAYSRTAAQVASHLYTALKEFLRIFDSYQKVPLYLATESYSAKFVILLANLIHKENAAASLKMKLKGISIGSGIIDPVNQQRRAEFLYQMGVVDPVEKLTVVKHEEEAFKAMENLKYGKAKVHNRAINRKIQMAGYKSPQDVSDPTHNLNSYKATIKFFESKSVQRDLHVEGAKFVDNPLKVFQYLETDLSKSSSKDLVKVMEQYNVLLYTGQYDLLVPTSQIDKVIENLPWNKKTNFRALKRSNWFVNGRLAGYYKSLGNLYQVMVRQANHLVARSQPLWTLKATSFIC